MTQNRLKWIALVSMLLDHIALTALSTGILRTAIGIERDFALRVGMIAVGQIAFPVFAWFAAEGSRKTSNMRKYLLRLFLFAVISEIPFQLCFRDNLSFGLHNVIFTLFFACAAIELGRWFSEKGGHEPWGQLISALIAVALGAIFYTDYNAWGVALVLGLYYLPSKRNRLWFMVLWITIFRLVWHGWNGTGFSWLRPSGYYQIFFWIGALISPALLAGYNEKQGRKHKWVFYWFYPCHLTILACITHWIEIS